MIEPDLALMLHHVQRRFEISCKHRRDEVAEEHRNGDRRDNADEQAEHDPWPMAAVLLVRE
jgi:hypothetical protein